MTRIKINDNDSNIGIECYYYPDYKTLYILPTNHKRDWLENFTGWLWPIWVWPGGLYNRKWWSEVGQILPQLELYDVENVIGYSKGGAQAWYYQTLHGCNVISVAGFPPWMRGPLPGKLYRKRGDIVPLFSKHRYYEEITREKWQPFWKSHTWTTTEIEEIIKENYTCVIK